jgi:DNA-binding NarL/FixJ family response regulator
MMPADDAEDAMAAYFVALSREGNTVGKIEVLIAVEPAALLQVIEHLFRQSEFRVIEGLSEWPALAQEASRLRPKLIIANVKLLGHGAARIISEVKLASPASKLIVISFPHQLESHARQWGADAYLEEEDLVRRLLPTAQELLGPGRLRIRNYRQTGSSAGSGRGSRKK